MSGPEWRLTRQAEASLTDIVNWTLDAFGPAQADAYLADLIGCCEDVAARRALTHSCRDRFDPGLSDVLEFARSGMHLVVFARIDGITIIVDFLHQQADLPRRLRNVSETDKH